MKPQASPNSIKSPLIPNALGRGSVLGIESAWLPPYVVLVINDNLYGLICALSYIFSVGPLACFELHMLESRLKKKRSFVDQGQGVSP